MKKLSVLLLAICLSNLTWAFDQCGTTLRGGHSISKKDISEDEHSRTFVIKSVMQFSKSASSTCLKAEMKKRILESEKCTFGVRENFVFNGATIQEKQLESSIEKSSCKLVTKSKCPYCLIPEVVKSCEVNVQVSCEKTQETRDYPSDRLVIKGIDLFF